MAAVVKGKTHKQKVITTKRGKKPTKTAVKVKRTTNAAKTKTKTAALKGKGKGRGKGKAAGKGKRITNALKEKGKGKGKEKTAGKGKRIKNALKEKGKGKAAGKVKRITNAGKGKGKEKEKRTTAIKGKRSTTKTKTTAGVIKRGRPKTKTTAIKGKRITKTTAIKGKGKRTTAIAIKGKLTKTTKKTAAGVIKKGRPKTKTTAVKGKRSTTAIKRGRKTMAVKGKRKPKTAGVIKRGRRTNTKISEKKRKMSTTKVIKRRLLMKKGKTSVKLRGNTLAKKSTRKGVKTTRRQPLKGMKTSRGLKIIKRTGNTRKPRESKSTTTTKRRIIRRAKVVEDNNIDIDDYSTFPCESIMTWDDETPIAFFSTVNADTLCNNKVHTVSLSECTPNNTKEKNEKNKQSKIARKSSQEKSIKKTQRMAVGGCTLMNEKKIKKAPFTGMEKSSLIQTEDTDISFPTAVEEEEEEQEMEEVPAGVEEEEKEKEKGEEETSATTTARSVVENENEEKEEENEKITALSHVNKHYGLYSVRWYQLGTPLLATRVRELFNRPLFNCHFNTESVHDTITTSNNNTTITNNNDNNNANSSSLPCSASMDKVDSSPSSSKLLLMPLNSVLSHADEEALSWLFPAIHNGEWFSTAWQFIDHCRSIPHKLLCEGVPLFPLTNSHGWSDETATTTTTNSVVTEMKSTNTALNCDNNNNNNNNDSEYKDSQEEQDQDQLNEYHWWFMYIHTAMMRYGLQEWFTWVSPERVKESLYLQYMGTVWCSCRMFQTAIANTLARRLSETSSSFSSSSSLSYSTTQWEVLEEAVIEITRLVQDVYVRMIRNAEYSLISGNMGETMDKYSVPVPTEVVNTVMNRNTLLDVYSNSEYRFSKDELENLNAFAVYLAKTVIDVFERVREDTPLVSTTSPTTDNDNNNNTNNDSINAESPHYSISPLKTSTSTVEKTMEHSSLHLPMNTLDSTSDNNEEDRTMALVVWLYLSNAAKQLDDTPIYTKHRCAMKV